MTPCTGTPGALRLGIDGSCLERPGTGIHRYTADLCRALDKVLPACEFFVYSRQPATMPVQSSRWINRCDPRFTRRLPRVLWVLYRCGRLAKADKLDAFWAPMYWLPHLQRGTLAVTTIHDLSYLVSPSTVPVRDRISFRAFLRSSVTRANLVAVVSTGTQDRVIAAFGPRATVKVPPAVGPQFTRRRAGAIEECRARWRLPEEYLLTVGARVPRKNLSCLVEAFLRLKEDQHLPKGAALVMAGPSGIPDKALLRFMESHPNNAIRLVDSPADDELACLYSGARMYVCASTYEGFCIPISEATACGCPVVATDSAETREAGGTGAIYAPATVSGLYSGIRQALRKPQESRPTGLPTWAESARNLAQAILGRLARRGDAANERACSAPGTSRTRTSVQSSEATSTCPARP
jgi:glycosyltransferase involved in cell wall biosynthesis